MDYYGYRVILWMSSGNSYKFKVGTKAIALKWYTYLREASKPSLDYKVSVNFV